MHWAVYGRSREIKLPINRKTYSAMMRISSNATLFLKFFIPVMWTTVVGGLSLVSLVYQFDYIGNMPANTVRMILLGVFLTGLTFFVATFLRLKRVEMDSHFIYVTNYFKTVRYPYHQIEKISNYNFLLGESQVIKLKQRGIFGRSFFYLVSKHRLKQFLQEQQEIATIWTEKSQSKS